MGNYKIKIAAISGASRALKFKEKNPLATEQEVIQFITSKMDEIIANIEDGEE
ncbi:MAG: hypothetical protein KJ600_06860 [Nanoarchaeota archaeon]|nr:hypothetical protein [Nanoarchaeota archaeon]MBU1104244.1 hypothetical protein [Nanoarchaeota archaeon]